MTSEFPTTPERSAIMAKIPSRGTKPELALQAAMEAQGLEFETHCRDLPGTPDFVFRDCRLAVFLDGDFWHGRIWRETGKSPATNRDAWIRKFEKNIERDGRVDDALRAMGWQPLRIWESEVVSSPDLVARLVLDRSIHERARAAQDSS